jgi:hypothetical protein
MLKEVYYLNLENYILDRFWNHAMYPLSEYLTGNSRVYFKPWIRLIIRHLDGQYIHYRTWVLNGGGDVWFVEGI